MSQALTLTRELEPTLLERYRNVRYMGDQATAEASTMKRIEGLLAEVTALAAQSPLKKPVRRKAGMISAMRGVVARQVSWPRNDALVVGNGERREVRVRLSGPPVAVVSDVASIMGSWWLRSGGYPVGRVFGTFIRIGRGMPVER